MTTLHSILWLAVSFVLGACVGSFLNVVAWRLPRKLSLLYPPSHCPACRQPISFRDNVPVLGWFLLKGKCRACQARISPRYPMVEFLSGALFALLAGGVIVHAGSSAVGDTLAREAPHSFFFDRNLLGLWAYEAVVMSYLLALVLLEIERARPTVWFVLLALAATLIPPLAWPELLLKAPEDMGVATALIQSSLPRGVFGALLGAALGCVLGLLYDPRPAERGRVVSLAVSLAIAGGAVGYPYAMSVAIFVVLVMAPLRVMGWWVNVQWLPRTIFALLAVLVMFLATS